MKEWDTIINICTSAKVISMSSITIVEKSKSS